MKVLIFGGAGFIGRNLSAELLAHGYEVSVVTRNRQKTIANLGFKGQVIEWDNYSPLASLGIPPDFNAVINLAGESIGSRRWSESVKGEILDSRIRTTGAIVTAINKRTLQPEIFINASAVGYYGPHQDEMITESAENGDDFLAQVCRQWENEAYKVQSNLTRVATVRTGVVLGREGALTRMILPYRFLMGGPLGTGKQWLSWIHIKDLTSVIRFIIEQPELSGPINAAAPEPLKMKDFCQVLGKVLRRPSWLPVPELILQAALGQMSEMLIHGQRVMPKKILDAGFKFQFPNLEPALRDILNQPNG